MTLAFPALQPYFTPYVLVPGCKACLFVLGVRYRIHGRVESRTLAPICVANHVSWIDACVMQVAVPRGGAFVAKAGVLKAPMLGDIALASQSILVRRSADAAAAPVSSAPASPTLESPQGFAAFASGAQAMLCVDADPAKARAEAMHEIDTMTPVGTPVSRTPRRSAKEAAVTSTTEAREAIMARSLDASKPRVILFPEGTTTNGNALIHFKLGAFHPLQPVQAAVIRYPFRRVDVSYTVTMSLSLLRVLSAPYHTVDVTWLPPMPPLAGEGPAEFARRVREAMAATLGVAKCDHTLEDLRFQDSAVAAFKAAKVTGKGGSSVRAVCRSFNVQSVRLRRLYETTFEDIAALQATWLPFCIELRDSSPPVAVRSRGHFFMWDV